MPETVYIVAGGPNGVPHYSRIPDNAYTLAVNQSVLISDIHPDLWVINSVNKFVLTWMEEATRVFPGIRVFKESCIEKTPKRFRKKEFFFYKPTRNIESKTAKIGPDTFYVGGTVSGFAIQIAAQLRAKEIILCGVDMSGQLYWNGISRNRPTHGKSGTTRSAWISSFNIFVKHGS